MQCLVTELQCNQVRKTTYLFSHRNLWFYVIGLLEAIAVSESASEVLPYYFEPVSIASYSDNEDSSSESETNIREQASFTE